MKKIIHTYTKQNSGFTLIELLIYVAISSILIGSLTVFLINTTQTKTKNNISNLANQNLKTAMYKINYEIRNSQSINSVSSSSICLQQNDSSRNPTQIYLNSGVINIAWGGGSSDCTSTSNDQTLTNSNINVSDLSFTNLSTGNSENISYEVTVTVDTDAQTLDYTNTFSSSAELRGF